MRRRYANLHPLLLTSALMFGGATPAALACAADGDAGAVSGGRPAQTGATRVRLPAPGDGERVSPPGAPAQSVAGTYRYKTYRAGKEGYDNELVVREGEGGKLQVSLSGSYIYPANGAETMKEASGEGTATLGGGVATASVTPDGSEGPCRVDITFSGAQAVVKAADDCGFNIVLDGTYVKVGAGPKPARAGSRAGNVAGLREVTYDGLADFVNDFEKNKIGQRYVITSVPAEKINKVLREGKAGAVPGHRGLFQLEAEGDEGGVASGFITSATLVKSLLADAEFEPAGLRVTATLVEFAGEFDVYRTSFVTKIEGLNDDGSVLWTAVGPPPPRVRYRQ